MQKHKPKKRIAALLLALTLMLQSLPLSALAAETEVPQVSTEALVSAVTESSIFE